MRILNLALSAAEIEYLKTSPRTILQRTVCFRGVKRATAPTAPEGASPAPSEGWSFTSPLGVASVPDPVLESAMTFLLHSKPVKWDVWREGGGGQKTSAQMSDREKNGSTPPFQSSYVPPSIENEKQAAPPPHFTRTCSNERSLRGKKEEVGRDRQQMYVCIFGYGLWIAGILP